MRAPPRWSNWRAHSMNSEARHLDIGGLQVELVREHRKPAAQAPALKAAL